MKKCKLKIENMMCSNCEQIITGTLMLLKGVSNIELEAETQTVQFQYKSDTTLTVAIEILQMKGYNAGINKIN